MDGYTDLKLPKPTKKDLAALAPTENSGPRYPYGMRLRFESDLLKKFPELKRAKIEEDVVVEAVGVVTEIRKVEGESNSHSIELQLTGLRFPALKNADDDAAFASDADDDEK